VSYFAAAIAFNASADFFNSASLSAILLSMTSFYALSAALTSSITVAAAAPNATS